MRYYIFKYVFSNYILFGMTQNFLYDTSLKYCYYETSVDFGNKCYVGENSQISVLYRQSSICINHAYVYTDWKRR